MMRSMLTHPEAGASARAVLSSQIAQVAESLPVEDAPVRAALMTTILLGVTVGHQLLQLDELREASHEGDGRPACPARAPWPGADPRTREKRAAGADRRPPPVRKVISTPRMALWTRAATLAWPLVFGWTRA